MQIESGNTELEMYRIGGLVANAKSALEKALLIEKEFGKENIYTMVAMGTPLLRIAEGFGITRFELEFALKRTAKHRREFINAQAFAAADKSAPTLNSFSKKKYMVKGEAAAAKHHAQVVANAAKLLNMGGEDKGGNSVTVNNTVVVRDKSEVPTLPDGLANVIDAEFENVDTES